MWPAFLAALLLTIPEAPAQTRREFDAQGRFDRSDFGMNIGLPRFSPEIKLAIQVEAVKAD